MIGQALDCIADDINAHLKRAHGDNVERAILSNIVDQEGNPPLDTENKVVLTLISLDEERNIYDRSSPERVGALVARTSDPIYLNLHVVFAATHRHYRSGLEALSAVIAYLKAKQTFNHHNTPKLPEDVRQLSFNLEKLAYADLSNIWSYLGANYLPAATYTIRIVGLGARQIQSADPAIETTGVRA